ncbi:PH domain-containing protein [Bacillus sp. DJP31]|uniref:PH domain-containing protein n=1 Tax=Bacillus sp. DJP31 TaxID=3409789 RepID=UPI003BB68FE4
MMNRPKRLHPVAAVIRFLRSLRKIALPLLIFFFINGRGENSLMGALYYLGVTGIVVGMLIFGILSWYRFTYRVEEGELRIEHGILVRKKRYIPIEKIQTIDVSAGLIQRLFGLVKIQIETAGGGDEAEAVLSAITSEEAEVLRMTLTNKSTSDDLNEEVQELEKFTLGSRDLFIMASTTGGIGVVISAIIAFLTQFDELLPTEYVYSLAKEVIQSGFVLISMGIFFVVLFSWVISIVSTSIKFGNYKLTKKGVNLFITRGLVEKRELTIPINRIQAVRIQENFVRQFLGYATVYIEVAGGATGKGEDYSTVLLPIIPIKKVSQLLVMFTPEFMMDEELHPLPKRAKVRYITRLVIPTSIIVILVSFFLNPWGYISLILLPLAVILGAMMHSEAGWITEGNRLKLRYRFLNRHTVFARKNRIQAFHLTHSYFQRKVSVSSIIVSTQSKSAGKHFKVVDVDESHALELYEWYSYEKSASTLISPEKQMF